MSLLHFAGVLGFAGFAFDTPPINGTQRLETGCFFMREMPHASLGCGGGRAFPL
jgi:hypothetical protein